MTKTTIFCSILLIALSCNSDKSHEANTKSSPRPVLRIDTLASTGPLLIRKISDNKDVDQYELIFGDADSARTLLASRKTQLDSIHIDTIQWGSKAYPDFRLSYKTYGEHSYGQYLGGWEKKYKHLELIDGKSGQLYFKAEPYSWSFEEHNITGDTSHPLAATSCFFQYQIYFFPGENFLVIDNLEGPCLPDLESGKYIFKNNELLLKKD